MAINIDAIIGEASRYMKTNEGKKKAEKAIDDIVLNRRIPASGRKARKHTLDETAKKFIQILREEITNSASGASHSSFAEGRIGATAISALLPINHSIPIKIASDKYLLSVSFENDLSRDSLFLSKYPEGVSNLAALLNSGYSAKNSVYGAWHGQNIRSLSERDGARYIERAIDRFMSECASEYGVVEIKVSPEYNIDI